MITTELLKEQGTQAMPLIASSFIDSDFYDAIAQQGNQATPIIVSILSDKNKRATKNQGPVGISFDKPQPHIVENPLAMFANLDFKVYLTENCFANAKLLYKEPSDANWNSVVMLRTSYGYFAEVKIGWGHHMIEYKVQIDGSADSTVYTCSFNAVPMTPSFVDIISSHSIYYARLRFGANYPDMNTAETIEYSFDNETWTDAVRDATSGYELADVTRHNAGTLYFRTKLVSDSSVTSETVTMHIQLQSPS